MTVREPDHYEFGEFHVNTKKRLLLRNGDSVALTPKVFDTLLYLLQHQGEVVEKSELMRAIGLTPRWRRTTLARTSRACAVFWGRTGGQTCTLLPFPAGGIALPLP